MADDTEVDNSLVFYDQDVEEENLVKNTIKKALQSSSSGSQLLSHASDFASSQVFKSLNDSQKSSSGLTNKRRAGLEEPERVDYGLDDLEEDLTFLNQTRKKKQRQPLGTLFGALSDDELEPPPATALLKSGVDDYRFKPAGKRYVTCHTESGCLYIPKASLLSRKLKFVAGGASMDSCLDTRTGTTGFAESKPLLEVTVANLMQEIYLESQEKKGMRKKVPLQDAGELMWVDKYAPKRFTDIIGDGRTLREVMQWVRSWDYAVFKRETPFTHPQRTAPPVMAEVDPSSKRAAYDKLQYERALANYRKQLFELKERAKDKLRRPLKRVLLISGGPGVGKTTIAHVVARQAGYEPCEINASDDRSGATLEAKVTGALQCQHIRSNKPSLVILDEIDGVLSAGEHSGASFNLIKFLLKAVADSVSSKKGEKKGVSLTRPIICICNDLYAPALKPLRAVALCLQLRPPAPRQLAQRLIDICGSEGIATDMQAMMTLGALARSDIRSCLHALQFFGRRHSKLKVEHLKDLHIGIKDGKRQLFSAITALFTKAVSSEQSSSALIAQTVEESGEYERLMQALFENYPKSKGADTFALSGAAVATTGSTVPSTLVEVAQLPRIIQAQEWFSFYDSVAHRVLYLNQWALGNLLTVPFSALHSMFASVSSNVKSEIPKVSHNAYLQTEFRKQILLAFVKQLPVVLQARWGHLQVLMELNSLLVGILNPVLSAQSPHSLSQSDLNAIRRSIRLLRGLHLSLVRVSEEDSLAFHLSGQPDISELCLYPRHLYSSVSAAMQQYVLREFEKAVKSKAGCYTSNVTTRSKAVEKDSDTVVPATNHSALRSIADFFQIGAPERAATRSVDTSALYKSKPVRKVWYKYNEGYSNAVRKPAVLAEFF